MGILAFIIFGGLAGWVASIFTKNNSQMGIVKNIIVGLLGSLLGGFIASGLGFGGVTEFSFRSFLIAVLGSVLLLWVVNFITGRK
ncbi:MAG TPA: GlsB/YeaQ/YmgE family stress response membrane protein [Acholeplasma sp.]|nr:GlsB/YeaQ/YmgE family stress response membrane protein [Acholeplasma sp.]